MDILPRLDSISQDQIQKTLDHDSDSRDSFLLFDPKKHSNDINDMILHTSYEQSHTSIQFCNRLLDEARHPRSHASRIDRLLSGLIRCRYCRPELPEGIVSDTQHLLRRLPVYSQPLPMASPSWMDEAYSQSDTSAGGLWENLTINNTCSLNILRIAIYIRTRTPDMRGVQKFLMFLGQLLTIASQRHSRQDLIATQAGYIVSSAIWTSWQRVKMLYLFAIVSRGVHIGFRSFDAAEIVSREFFIGTQTSVHDMPQKYASQGKSNYMCAWAFELLAEEPCCIGADFRRFHERFNSAWGQQPGRCRNEQGELSYCRGMFCRRLTGLKVKDQSSHDEGCDGNCCRLVWDEKSYLSVEGTRAVDVTRTSTESGIQYCSASFRSLAISHVWSHGLGGRPEDGINECLHKRYSKLATRYDCDSYWWDTACIPEPHHLRREAIRGINRTFATSKVVLVCDQDIMKIDISECTIRKKEILLVTVLVSDWNVRAWTYLESMRGRDHLYLLCKRNLCINFLDLVKDVCSEGCVDIAILSLAAPHMLKWDTSSPPLKPHQEMSLELAGSALSHRPASRKGDDLVIWTLLIGLDNDSSTPLPFEGVEQDSEEFSSRFWKTFVDRQITTGFLMSNVPRITIPSLTWAPRTASCMMLENDFVFHSYFDGENTSLARITDEGIIGEWMMYEFSVVAVRSSPVTPSSDANLRRLKEICKEHFGERCSKGALIHPVTDESRNSMGSLIQPITGARILTIEGRPMTKQADYQGLIYQGYRGHNGGTLLALLSKGSQDDHHALGWTWKGISPWSDSVDFPPFKLVQNVLIS